MTLAASNDTNGDQSVKSIEEQDHLSRSTKKLKAHRGDEDDNMAEPSSAIEGPTDFLNNFDANSGARNLSKPQALKSFKEALTNRSYNEQAFDEDLNRLSTDEDESETEAMEEELCDDEPDLGIPQIKLPRNLLSKIRRPWKDCLIVKPLGKTYFAITKYTYGTEYEHLHFFCFNCGRVGHRRDHCSVAPVNPSGDIVPEKESVQNLTVGNEKESRPSCNESDKAHSNDPRSDQPSEGFGIWMLVSRRSPKHSYVNKKEARSRSREKAHGKGPSKQTQYNRGVMNGTKSSMINQIPQDRQTGTSIVSVKNTIAQNPSTALAGLDDLMEGVASESTESCAAPSSEVPSSSLNPWSRIHEHKITTKKPSRSSPLCVH
ncbi:hypothetical protein LOK49_Contig136G00009 [Camellia lanceoleosa]|nr:hypothetical protein LOK49_Contig136G00009 [Camellia lanceoleosa]